MSRGWWVAVVVVALVGCTGPTPEPQITSSPEPIPSSVSTPDPRIERFSSKNPTARAAYAFAARVALRYQFNPEYLRLSLDEMVPADFDQFSDVLTKSAQDTLEEAADDRDADTVRAMTFVDFPEELGGTGLRLRPGPAVVTSQRVTDPRYDFRFGEAVVWLTSSGEVAVDSPGGPRTVPYAVRMKLEVHDTDDGLRIHAWDSTWAFNGDAPQRIE